MDISKLSVDEETLKLLAHVLADLTAPDPAKPWTGHELRLQVPSEQFPVPELARAALESAGFVHQRWEEKTAWRVGGQFRGRNVSFASTKFGLKAMVETDRELTPAPLPAVKLPTGVLTSIKVDLSQDPDLKAFADGFVAAVKKAARVFGDRVLGTFVSNQVDDGNVTLLNQSYRLRGAYNLFRWQGQALIDGHGNPQTRKDMAAIALRGAGFDPANPSLLLPFFLDTNVGYCLTAMASAYFSWLEHVLVLALPFTPHWDPARKPVTQVIGDSWSDKWRNALRAPGATADAEEKRVFDLLASAAEQFRNLDAHGGFGKKEQALLAHTPLGAIPARLVEGAGPIKAQVISEAPSTFPEACAVFDEVDTFLHGGPMREAFTWIEGGLQVPFNAEFRQRIREAIDAGGEAFAEEVDVFAAREDALNNFE